MDSLSMMRRGSDELATWVRWGRHAFLRRTMMSVLPFRRLMRIDRTLLAFNKLSFAHVYCFLYLLLLCAHLTSMSEFEEAWSDDDMHAWR